MATLTPVNIIDRNSISSGYQECINSSSISRPASVDIWKRAVGYYKLLFSTSSQTAPYTDTSIGFFPAKQLTELFGGSGGGTGSAILAAFLKKYF